MYEFCNVNYDLVCWLGNVYDVVYLILFGGVSLGPFGSIFKIL